MKQITVKLFLVIFIYEAAAKVSGDGGDFTNALRFYPPSFWFNFIIYYRTCAGITSCSNLFIIITIGLLTLRFNTLPCHIGPCGLEGSVKFGFNKK